MVPCRQKWFYGADARYKRIPMMSSQKQAKGERQWQNYLEFARKQGAQPGQCEAGEHQNHQTPEGTSVECGSHRHVRHDQGNTPNSCS